MSDHRSDSYVAIPSKDDAYDSGTSSDSSFSNHELESASKAPSFIRKIDNYINMTWLGNFFLMKQRGARFSREISSGTVMFLMVAWCVGLHARTISRSGTLCTETYPDLAFDDPTFTDCVEQSKKELITGTCIAGIIGTLMLGLWANFPGVLVPGGSTTPYFAYSVVGYMGTGDVSYRAACTAVFLEGLIFLILSVTGLRSIITKLIPRSIVLGLRSGIGLFMTFMALQGPHGLGIVVGHSSTLVTLGTCDESYRTPIDTGENYFCDGGRMTDLRLLVSMIVMIPVIVGYNNGHKGAVIAGLGFLCLIMWIPRTAISEFPDTEEGNEDWEYFKQIFSFEPVTSLLFPFSFGDMANSGVWVAFTTLFYVDLMDTTGVLYSVAAGSSLLDEDGKFFGERAAFSSDAVATVVGSCFGSSPLTTALETSMAIALGGRTGMVAVWASFLYFLLMFMVPVLSHIPQYAYTVGFAIGGVYHLTSLNQIDWSDLTESVPAFLACFLSPLTYSVANPLILSLFVYIALWLCQYLYEHVVGFIKSKKDEEVEYTKSFKAVEHKIKDAFRIDTQGIAKSFGYDCQRFSCIKPAAESSMSRIIDE